MSEPEDDNAPPEIAPTQPKRSRPRPNGQPSAGSIGNTVGLITPKPLPQGRIEDSRPTGNTDPSVEPETSEEASFWARWGDVVHAALDLGGFVPGAGMAPDLLNALIYALEGEKANAIMSAVAAVPGAGDAAKAGAMIATGGKRLAKDGGERATAKAADGAAGRPTKEAAEHQASREATDTPATSAGGGGKRRDGGYSAARRMEPHEVPCFKKGKGNKATDEEYDRQLADQQKALNEMTVEEYQQARKVYADTKRGKEAGAEAARLRQDFQSAQIEDRFNRKRAMGMGSREARAEAAKEAAELMKSLDALHSPDLVAAGKATPTGLGHQSANRSIGGQWPRKDRISGLDQAATLASQQLGRGTKMNVRLTRCR